MTDTPTRKRRPLHAPFPQSVTFVELFFDLVFVFAVTQVTALTAHDLTLGGIARSLVVFWLIWWAWTQFTWTLNPADTTHVIVRIVTLAATAAAFVMAGSVGRAFADDALWFALPYLVVRALGLALQVRVDLERGAEREAGILRWAGISTIGLVIVLAGALADPSVRAQIWVVAILTDLLATQAASDRAWDIHPAHLAERHGLFVIIALGESLIVAATAVAGETRTAALAGAALATIVVTCLLWWSYFGWFKEALEERFAAATPRDVGPLARDAYSLGHFPMLCGIISFAVAVEATGAHPDAPLAPEALVALALGVSLFVGFAAVPYWRLSGRILATRLAVLAVMVGGLVAVGGQPPIWAFTVVAVALLAIVVIEAIRPEFEPVASDKLESPAHP